MEVDDGLESTPGERVGQTRGHRRLCMEVGLAVNKNSHEVLLSQ